VHVAGGTKLEDVQYNVEASEKADQLAVYVGNGRMFARKQKGTD